MKGLIIILSSAFALLLASCAPPQRSKEKLYEVFFGRASDNCVKILEARDARAIDDQMMYIHFKACPNEIKRILSLAPYSIKPMNKRLMDLAYEEPDKIDENLIPSLPKWWNIRKLGTSCFTFEYYHDDKDYAQIGYFSTDSSEVYYKEIAW